MKLYLGGYLSWYAPRKATQLEISLNGLTLLKDVASQLELPLGEIAIAAINGKLVSLYSSAQVCDADSVEFHPPNGGG